VPPPWLRSVHLSRTLEWEYQNPEQFTPPPRLPQQLPSATTTFSPPFVANSTADGLNDVLPYHWLELGETLLSAASDDFEDSENIRKLLRSLREVRMAKLRQGMEILDAGGGVKMNGVGGMELGEARSFITGVVDVLRKIGASREQQRKDREREERENGYSGTGDYDDDEMDMQ